MLKQICFQDKQADIYEIPNQTKQKDEKTSKSIRSLNGKDKYVVHIKSLTLVFEARSDINIKADT